MLLVVALMATVQPQFRSWVSSPTFDTKGHCAYTIFVQGNVPYYWTMDDQRMVAEPIDGIDSQVGLVPYNHTAYVDIRTFLSQEQKYGEPTWQWSHTLYCEEPKKKDRWIQRS